MTRFFALSLMTVTAAVIAGFIAPDANPSDLPWWSLGLPLLIVGFLFGLLASERHLVWGLITAVVVIVILAQDPIPALAPKPPTTPAVTSPQPPRKLPVALLLLPPACILAGSFAGAYLIRRRHRKITQPESSD